MSISALPSHILFSIIARIVAGYIDTAIASPPAPRWMHRFSKPAIILVRDFLATQVKSGLREPPYVPVGSNLTEWSNITEGEFLAILRELIGEKELESFLLPEIPSVADDVDELDDDENDDEDESPSEAVAEDDNPRDGAVECDVSSVLPPVGSTNANKEVAEECVHSTVAEGETDCDSTGEMDSLVSSQTFVSAEETKVVKELAESTVDVIVTEDDTASELPGENELDLHSPVPSDSPTVLASPKENTADSDGVASSTAAEEENPANVKTSDNDVGSDTGGDWTEEWFQEWFAIEEREPLTRNTIVHLMGINGAFREATLKAINLTLGIKRGRKKILNKRMTVVLRDLRMRYRLAVTPDLLHHIDHGIDVYSGPKTPLIDAYLALICGGYLLRCFHRLDRFQETGKSFSLDTRQMIQKMNNVLAIAARLSPKVLRTQVFQRAYIFHTRLEKYLALVNHFRRIGDAYDSVKTGPEPDAPIHLYNCPRLKNSVQEFALWDEFSMGIAIFPEFPRPLIEASLIRPELREIIKLEKIEKLKANEDLMIAVHISRILFEKWSRRHKDWPDFHVVVG